VIQPPAGSPVLVSEFGNPKLDVEHLLATEVGYRVQPDPRWSLDATAFFNHYDQVSTLVPDPVRFEPRPAPGHVVIPRTFQNALHGETFGLELSAQWQPIAGWHVTASYTALRMHLRPDPAMEQDSPRQQWQIRSYLDLPH